MNFVGSWKLVSALSTDAEGVVTRPYGDNPVGFLTYTSDGRVWAICNQGGRKRLSGDWVSAPAAERAEAFATTFAYAGRYVVRGEHVVHYVEAATIENWVDTEQVRQAEFQGNRLTLRAPSMSYRGIQQTFEIVWERLPGETAVR
jgi:hypothetical protein